MKSISYEEAAAFDPESTNLAAIPTEDLERSLTTLEQLQREYFPVGDKERENFDQRATNLKNRIMENKLKPNEYKCAECGNVYEFGWSDEEARAEAAKNFGESVAEHGAIVCDDCYNKIMEVHNTKKN